MKPLKLLGVAAFASLILSAATHNANACAALDRAEAILKGASGGEQATALAEIRDGGGLQGGCERIQIAIDRSAQLVFSAVCANAYSSFTAPGALNIDEELRRFDQCENKAAAVTDASFQSIAECLTPVFRSHREEDEAMWNSGSPTGAERKALGEKSLAAFDACMPAG